MSHCEQTGRMPSYLLEHQEVTVRRNAALLLGMLGEPSAIKVLAHAMKDADSGVRHHALEALARLGNREAKQELAFMTNSGIGSEEVFAINALSATGDPTYIDTFRYKLATAAHIETRLAAAAALGRHGLDDGFEVARQGLRVTRPVHNDPDDPPAGQIMRIRQLATAAFGAMGRLDALPVLQEVTKTSRDPRVQVSAARAILDILAADRERGLPFSAAPREGR
jgi:HEAT repeat protein